VLRPPFLTRVASLLLVLALAVTHAAAAADVHRLLVLPLVSMPVMTLAADHACCCCSDHVCCDDSCTDCCCKP
jgi:hypothetical protein